MSELVTVDTLPGQTVAVSPQSDWQAAAGHLARPEGPLVLHHAAPVWVEQILAVLRLQDCPPQSGPGLRLQACPPQPGPALHLHSDVTGTLQHLAISPPHTFS